MNLAFTLHLLTSSSLQFPHRAHDRSGEGARLIGGVGTHLCDWSQTGSAKHGMASGGR